MEKLTFSQRVERMRSAAVNLDHVCEQLEAILEIVREVGTAMAAAAERFAKKPAKGKAISK